MTKYPLGVPLGKSEQPAPARVPVPGRPDWFTDGKGGEPFYVERNPPEKGSPP